MSVLQKPTIVQGPKEAFFIYLGEGEREQELRPRGEKTVNKSSPRLVLEKNGSTPGFPGLLSFLLVSDIPPVLGSFSFYYNQSCEVLSLVKIELGVASLEFMSPSQLGINKVFFFFTSFLTFFPI